MKMHRFAIQSFLPTLVLALAATAWADSVDQSATTRSGTADAGWHQFRGPDRSGRSPETGLLRSWPEEGPPVLWRRPLGEGFSGISIAGDRLFTGFAEGEVEYLGAFRAADGEELWRLPLGEIFRENFGNGPRATPTVDGGLVYALGARGRLVAADAASGEERWRLELAERFPIVDPQTLNPMAAREGPQLPLYGYAGSPLVEGDLVIVETGAGKGRSLVALDKRTGEVRWTALDDEIGYSSPVAVELGGDRQVLLLPGSSLVAISPGGEEQWRYPWALTPSQPLFVPPDRVFVSTVSGVGALLLRVSVANGEASFEELWRNRRLRNAWNSSIVAGDHLFGFDNATLRAVDLATGEMLWAARGLGQGTLLFADGLLIALSDRGVLKLLEADPEAYRERGSVDLLSGRTWTSPTLQDGVLYVRNQEEMVAVDLRRAPRPVSEAS